MWVDPLDNLWIADGERGIRQVLPNGTITSVELGSGTYNIRAVIGDATGDLYASTNGPDYLLKISGGTATQVVGTGSRGYNGTVDSNCNFLSGNQVQIDQPSGLAVRSDGAILFADTGNNIVRAYFPGPDTVVDLGGRARHHRLSAAVGSVRAAPTGTATGRTIPSSTSPWR